MSAHRKLPKFCCEYADKKGNYRIYFRRKGQRKIRLKELPWSPPFMEEYHRCLEGVPRTIEKVAATKGTWKWLCQKYFASAEFTELQLKTQIIRRKILEATFDEPIKSEKPDGPKFADVPLDRFKRYSIMVLRDRKCSKLVKGAIVKTPEAANARLKAIKRVLYFAQSGFSDLVPFNPASRMKRLASASGGFHTWTLQELKTFLKVHKKGTKARLAFSLLFYTGVRRSDVVALGRQNIQDGRLIVRPKKTSHLPNNIIRIPIAPELAEELEAGKNGHLTFLVTEFGKPFSAVGFSNKFKEWCKEAGLPHCSAHGLRKAAASIAAENGATENQLSAMFGWRTESMPRIYTKDANKDTLAAEGSRRVRIEEN